MKDEPAVGVELDDHGDGKFSLSGSASFSNTGPLLFAGQKLFIGHDEVTIDLANANFASTAGLALLMEWSSLCRLAGVSLVFERPQESLVELLRANDVEEMLPVSI